MPGKVLLVNLNRMQPAVAPIAIDYLGTALRQRGIGAELLDLCFADDVDAEIERCLAGGEASAVALSLRNTDDTSFATQQSFLPSFRRIIEGIRAGTAAPLILGGCGFSLMPEPILEYCGLDFGIWGEGEHALPELVQRIAASEAIDDIPGLIYRAEGGLRRNPPIYIDLEGWPTPQRDLVDNRRYFAEGGMGNIEAKRGCPMRCIYCADPLCRGSRSRLRPPQSVADEVEALLGMGIDHLHFCDSEFNLPPQHAMAVCRQLIERGLGGRLKWYAYCSPAPFTDEMADLAVRSGCAGINFGVDSGSDRVLRALGRDFTAAEVASTAEICHRHGIVFLYDLLLGGPGETRETLRETIEAMKRMSPSRIGVSLGVRICPGTALAAMVLAQGPLADNPAVHGEADGSFLAPAYYLDAALGAGAEAYLDGLIGGDRRFFFMSGEDAGSNYNYSGNTVLVDAIRSGYRGAFWDILRRLSDGG